MEHSTDSWEKETQVDNGTTYATVGHVFRGDFNGNRGRDVCLEMFGEQDEECIRYNEARKLEND